MLPDDFDFDFTKAKSSDWFNSTSWSDAAASDDPAGALHPLAFDDDFLTPPRRLVPDPLQFSAHQRYESQPARLPPPRGPHRPDQIGGSPPTTVPKTLSFSRRSHGPREITGAIDEEFLRLVMDRSVTFNPVRLGFIPVAVWQTSRDVKFGDLVTDFFQRKNNANTRFYHKLYNALKITTGDPFYFDFIGVEWISDTVIRVDKRIFAQLLGIRTVDGSLFHRQGNFPSHGFVELTSGEATELLGDVRGVDFDIVRLLVHQDKVFVRKATCEAIENCKWTPAKQRGG